MIILAVNQTRFVSSTSKKKINYIKNKRKIIKENGESLTKNQKMMQGIAKWCSFYRLFPHEFAKDYLGVKRLRLFQQILLYAMNQYVFFLYLASRGQGRKIILC